MHVSSFDSYRLPVTPALAVASGSSGIGSILGDGEVDLPDSDASWTRAPTSRLDVDRHPMPRQGPSYRLHAEPAFNYPSPRIGSIV
jgi:hypothetical protein